MLQATWRRLQDLLKSAHARLYAAVKLCVMISCSARLAPLNTLVLIVVTEIFVCAALDFAWGGRRINSRSFRAPARAELSLSRLALLR